MTFDEIRQGIEEAPITQLPALLAVVVHRCVREDVFVPGGLEGVVRTTIGKAMAGIPLPKAPPV